MWFGTRARRDERSGGATLAHSLQLAPRRKLRKGHVLTAGRSGRHPRAGIAEITVAIPEAGDMMEDAAAGHIADVFALDGFAARMSARGG
jgi:molybdenum cofactor cytidylyltransferase